jgi:hypothetical protein
MTYPQHVTKKKWRDYESLWLKKFPKSIAGSFRKPQGEKLQRRSSHAKNFPFRGLQLANPCNIFID